MVIFPSKARERELFASGYDYIIGVDEVGMACLAGPVTVCATRFSRTFFEKAYPRLSRLRDSKALSAEQREHYAAELTQHALVNHVIVSAMPRTIDKINIYHASRHAMRRAIQQIAGDEKEIVLVDGNKPITGIKQDQRAIVKGDQKVFVIACASILAKVHRDNHMIRQAIRYPGYGFERHKGYPTKAHYAALKTLGPTKLHRMSFRGII